MKFENRGYRSNQRQKKGTICGRFEWKIRLPLNQAYCYKPIALVSQKILHIVLETFTLKSRLFWFMLPILGWVYLLCFCRYQGP